MLELKVHLGQVLPPMGSSAGLGWIFGGSNPASPVMYHLTMGLPGPLLLIHEELIPQPGVPHCPAVAPQSTPSSQIIIPEDASEGKEEALALCGQSLEIKFILRISCVCLTGTASFSAS